MAGGVGSPISSFALDSWLKKQISIKDEERREMGRPKKCRWVEVEPGVTFFKPRGIPLRGLEQTVITVDELEAMRLADFLELTQEEVAQKMKVSRPTVTRMLARARRAVAEALVHGKAIRIEGGDYQLGREKVQCAGCGQWEPPLEGGPTPEFCANCREPWHDPNKM
jgi:predicted DNA-binding protein (UPF0251 family)